MARKVDEPWTKCRNSTDLDWTRAFAQDGRDPRSWPQTKPCRGQHVLEQSNTANQHGACEMCPSPALHSSTHCSDDVCVDPVSGISTGGSETNVTPERKRLHSESGKGQPTSRDGSIERRRLNHNRRSCTTPCTILERHPVGTPVHREISTPPAPRVSPITRRWRLFVVSILQTERIGVRRENAVMMEEDL